MPSPRVMRHLLVAGQPEQRQRGGDLGQRVVVDVVRVVEVRAGAVSRVTWRNQLAACASVTSCQGERPSTVRASPRVGGDEREQLGDGAQVVVDQPWVHRLAEVAGVDSRAPVGWVGCPPRGTPRPARPRPAGSPRTSRGSVEQVVSQRSKRRRLCSPLLADRGPAQRAGFQHGAQMPFDRRAQPGQLIWPGEQP